ncbi:hypothetical protein LV84_01719 [Algoriphagus ratkowskyi]|uniref:Uncharacterized protein n=1 Tax=Algoriphagus ratkowskyi TaxID=57028 RepID=A0A2W7RC11_9BACT|nr:hypothetical protein [Algoriphagus ratkowskyi]PZX57591.1 hypothetical protein LV84_01719 [Algoriphagus ratkowskyi]TXD78868.1 hypothetical protein ESW18_04940 [Algoriphagus ratkowskyi]
MANDILETVIAIFFLTLLIYFLIRNLPSWRRKNSKVQVKIKYVRRETTKNGGYAYLELEILNNNTDEIFITEIQQRHLLGPKQTFMLQDNFGNTKISFWELREQFTRPHSIGAGSQLVRYYRFKLTPDLLTKKLFLQYKVLTKSRKAYKTEEMYFVPKDLEEKPFKVSKTNDL